MLPIGTPRLSASDPRIALLVKQGVYTDAAITAFFSECEGLFARVLSGAPTLAYTLHKDAIGDGMLSYLQSLKQALDRNTVGGPRNQVENLAKAYEGAKTTALQLAMAVQLDGGKSETDLLTGVLPAFRTKPRSVLDTLSSRFPWLLPAIDSLAHIRNSEQHTTTLFDDQAKTATFVDGKGNRLVLTYEELGQLGAHFLMAMRLIFDVQLVFFASGFIPLMPKYAAEFKAEDLKAMLARMKQLVPPPTAEERLVAQAVGAMAAEAINDQLK